MFRRVCVFCGSSRGDQPLFSEVARSVGRLLAERDIGLVYGGGNIGLMADLANSALEHGGEVIGVIPSALVERELAHDGLSHLHVVGSMHERKARMAELSEAFIALTGGLGTLEELFEVLTWAQLGFHSKPCGLLDVGGYYDNLLAFLDASVTARFVSEEDRRLLVSDSDPERLLAKLLERSRQSTPESARMEGAK